MNMISIFGWRAFAGCFSQRAASLVAAAVIAAGGGAWAQTGSFSIIDGPGLGGTLSATAGAVNSPPTIGLLEADHLPACPGTFFHYHGTLNGLPDPDPFGCGWGHVAAMALVTPSAISGPGIQPPRMRFSAARRMLSESSETASIVVPQAFFIPSTAGDAIALSQPSAMKALKKSWASEWIPSPVANFAKLDARNALKHSPVPMSRDSAPAAVVKKQGSGPRPFSFLDFSLTGPRAKLIDTPQQKQP